MLEVRKYPLRPAAVAYLRECLDIVSRWDAPDGRILPTLLLRLDLEAGHAWTYLPDGLDDDEVNDLHGVPVGLPSGPTYSTPDGGKTWYRDGVLDPNAAEAVRRLYATASPKEERVVALIRDFLRGSPVAYCIADEQYITTDDTFPGKAWADASRPFLVPRPSYMEVYSCLYAADAEAVGAVCSVLKSGGYWQDVILAHMPDGMPTIEPMQRVSEEEIRALVRNTEMIVTQVYDGAGWLIWSRAHGPETRLQD
jgi:hypothetical protein